MNRRSAIPIAEARTLADLGEPPKISGERAAWAREQFFRLGCIWYDSGVSDQERRRELEGLAVEVLREHRDVLPSISTLKRDVARVSFLPSVVEDLWVRAFPPTPAERAGRTQEWVVLEGVRSKIAGLHSAGSPTEAEALRRAAVAFFNKYLDRDEIGIQLRHKVRRDLAKG